MPYLANKLQELVRFLDAFERDAASLNPDDFQKTHRELLSAYGAIADNKQECREADQEFVEQLRRVTSDSSILRKETLQLHTTVFYYTAGAPANCQDAFDKAVDLRSEKENDVKYVLNEAVYRLVDEIEDMPTGTRIDLIAAWAEHVFDEPGVEDYWDDSTPYETVTGIDFPRFFIQLVRRWQRHGRVDLTAQKNKKENQLLHEGYFEKLKLQSPVIRSVLRKLGYLKKDGFLARLARGLKRMRGWLISLFHGVPAGKVRTVLYVAAGIACLLFAVFCILWIKQSNRNMIDWLDRYQAGNVASSGVESTVENP